MTDLGFGMADKRSVLIALFVFAMSSIYFQYPLPIDTNNVVRRFFKFAAVNRIYFYSAKYLAYIISDRVFYSTSACRDDSSVFTCSQRVQKFQKG